MESDLLGLLLDWARSRYFGKYRGEVVANGDETKRGRLKVKVPAVLGNAVEQALGQRVGEARMTPGGPGQVLEILEGLVAHRGPQRIDELAPRVRRQDRPLGQELEHVRRQRRPVVDPVLGTDEVDIERRPIVQTGDHRMQDQRA